MNPVKESDIRNKTIRRAAEEMLVAARTAPKARGIDNLEMAFVEKEDIKKVSDVLKNISKEKGMPEFMERDAENILKAEMIVFIGTKISPVGISRCNLCGFDGCEEKSKHSNIPCVFNTGDLGIAIGSAVSTALNFKVDNRVMYSAGMAALKMQILGPDTKIAYGIPLSVSSKNPFFDRKI